MTKVCRASTSVEGNEVKTGTRTPLFQPLMAVPNTASNMLPEMIVDCYLMSLPAGLYCFTNQPLPGAIQNGGLPGLCLSPARDGMRNVNVSGVPPDGWLFASGDSALVQIINGPGKVLVTIYKALDTPNRGADVQVRIIEGAMREDMLRSRTATPAAATLADTLQSNPVKADTLAHVHGHGHVAATFGRWLGERRSQNWIEGFAVAVPAEIRPADFSYQAVLGRGCLSPLIEAGRYCGSRGMARPLFGFRIRLHRKAADMYDVAYRASFIDGTTHDLVGNGEICESDVLAPLEAMQIILTPKLLEKSQGTH